ncbi:cytochrome b5 [Ceraceosorus guamensis]|uniref:Cytochrome b5 n=1 Tax=Ceraceosorus guamensis TaxID=1522189 RepID=A0A316VZX7_9BASI|nr:cytochrome b5 [Ceraceosorus guamensis]PWN43146.1 cytochrome b5 [Ceraceosorus guamensis]
MEPTTHPTHPPKDDPFTAEELAKYDGKDENVPVYVAIKGQIFDVTPKREMYSPGKGYSIFAGKDASRALGMSSLKAEDANADYSTLDEKQMKVLDDWVAYYTKRYNIVGKLVK